MATIVKEDADSILENNMWETVHTIFIEKSPLM